MTLEHEPGCPGEAVQRWRERTDSGLDAIERCKACGATVRTPVDEEAERYARWRADEEARAAREAAAAQVVTVGQALEEVEARSRG